MALRILFVSPSFYPSTAYGGPTVAMIGLVRALRTAGSDLRVLTTDADGARRLSRSEMSLARGSDGPILFCKRSAMNSVSPGLLLRMVSLMKGSDVVHLNAVFSFPTIPALAAARILRKPVVWTTFGAFQAWEGERKKILKMAWEWMCRLVAPQRVMLHVTSEAEKLETARRFPAPVTLIPHGVDAHEPRAVTARSVDVRLLFVGRIHPVKGLENLITACARLKLPWALTIAGEGDPDYLEGLLKLVREVGVSDHVRFVGAVSGEEKEQLFASADLVVIPSFKENFSLVALEALVRSLPIIASAGTPWAKVREVGCGWHVENTPVELQRAIEESATADLVAMGRRGREWVLKEYQWPVIAEQFLGLYQAMVRP